AAGGRAEDRAFRQFYLERAEAAFVDVEIGRGQRLEGNARGGNATGTAGVQRTVDLRLHLAEIHCHPRPVDDDLHLDAQRHPDVAAVVVQEALGFIDAVRDALDDATHRQVGMVPDAVDAL